MTGRLHDGRRYDAVAAACDGVVVAAPAGGDAQRWPAVRTTGGGWEDVADRVGGRHDELAITYGVEVCLAGSS